MTTNLIDLLNEAITPLSLHDKSSYTILLNKINNARLVLLGEASHGTQEFYEARIAITKQLITDKKFHVLAIEGGYAHATLINNYIQGEGSASDVVAALEGYRCFPSWMWRNAVFSDFLRWLRDYNDELGPESKKITCYGLDLYSLNTSVQAVKTYLQKEDPGAFKKAEERYAYFDPKVDSPDQNTYLHDRQLKLACMQAVNDQLLEMQVKRFSFDAIQHARLIKNAEHYYRALTEKGEAPWNIRGYSMCETLQNVMSHIETLHEEPAKVIVWAHNSHVGDARATESSHRQQISLGQLVRERFSNISYNIGFSTYSGTVIAASEWGGTPEIKTIASGLPDSYQGNFHLVKSPNFYLDLHCEKALQSLLAIPCLMRAIGSVYKPGNERQNNYFYTRVVYQFDAIVHLDATSAVQPLP